MIYFKFLTVNISSQVFTNTRRAFSWKVTDVNLIMMKKKTSTLFSNMLDDHLTKQVSKS